MPRKKLTLYQKLNNAKKRLDRILRKYDNNREYIVMKGTDYVRIKDSNLKAIYNDYQSLLRAEKVIHQISNEIVDESSSFDENENDNGRINSTTNCLRHDQTTSQSSSTSNRAIR
jgi:hypothetical protein